MCCACAYACACACSPRTHAALGLGPPYTMRICATILFAHAAHISLSKRGYQVLKDKKEDITEKPESGCIIYGLFLEGAKWDEEHMMVAESSPKELFVTFPLMWFIPETLRTKPTQGI